MGRTIPSFRIALEHEISSWRPFKQSLGDGSRERLESLFDAARSYCSASSNSVRPTEYQGMFMAMSFDHERRLADLTNRLENARLELDVKG